MSAGNPSGPLRVELGGGAKPRPGYLNLDKEPAPGGVVLDLDAPGLRLPFEDATVDFVYSCHCLEHLADYRPVLREVVRVCRVGAEFELRVPHWLHPMAMCYGHRHTFCQIQVEHWTSDPGAVPFWFGGCPRRLKLRKTEWVVGPNYRLGRRRFPQLGHEELCETFPGACHEYAWWFEVIPNEPGGTRRHG